MQVSHSDEFDFISESQLIDLISNDDLETESGEEEEVFRAVMRWAENIQEENNANSGAVWAGAELATARVSRGTNLHHVLSHVRLPKVSPYFLHDCVETHR